MALRIRAVCGGIAITFSYPGRACAVIVRHPILLPPMSAKQRKRKEDTKEKVHSVCPARPSPPRHRPKLHLTSIPYMLHPSPGPPKPCPREGPCPPALVVGAAISHRAAPVLPTPLDGVSPLVPPCARDAGRACRNWSKNRPLVLLRVVGRGAAFLGVKPTPTSSWEGLVDRSGLLPVSLCRSCVGACLFQSPRVPPCACHPHISAVQPRSIGPADVPPYPALSPDIKRLEKIGWVSGRGIRHHSNIILHCISYHLQAVMSAMTVHEGSRGWPCTRSFSPCRRPVVTRLTAYMLGE